MFVHQNNLAIRQKSNEFINEPDSKAVIRMIYPMEMPGLQYDAK